MQGFKDMELFEGKSVHRYRAFEKQAQNRNIWTLPVRQGISQEETERRYLGDTRRSEGEN